VTFRQILLYRGEGGMSIKSLGITAKTRDNLENQTSSYPLSQEESRNFRITAKPRGNLENLSGFLGHLLSSNELQYIKRTPRVNSGVLPYTAIRSNPYLFENWGALLAAFKPYFFLSFIRGSLVRKPAFFRTGLKSPST